MKLLSIIIPSYNEEKNIPNTTRGLAEMLNKENIEYELIYISDGSKDETYEAILEENAKDPRVKGAQFSRNFGKEASIFAGLELACGDGCIIMDCDLQHPPEVIPEMYALWQEGYEIVEGIKNSRGKESLFHKMFANTFYGIMSKLMKMDMKSSSDFKLIDRKVVDVINSLPEHNKFLRGLFSWTGFKQTAYEYERKERFAGTIS